MADGDEPLERAALREAVELHAFFESWLGGTCPDTAEVFARLERALAPGFSMVTPAGTRLTRAEVTRWLRGAYGAKALPAPFRIAVREPAILHAANDFVAVSYVEEQWRGDALERRLSTAVLCPDPGAPGRVQWLLVHETAMPPGADGRRESACKS